MSSRSFGGSKSGGDPRKQLETLIGAALHTKGGRVSASKISAVSDCALKMYKRHAKEVVAVLMDRMRKCEDSKRLVSIYIIDSVIMRSHKKLGNNSYPKLLQSQLSSVFELVSYASAKDKKQIGKVLGKFRDNDIFPERVVSEWARAARVSLPKPGELALKRSDSISSRSSRRGSTESSSREKQAEVKPHPPLEPPPVPKPPPVTLSLGSKRTAEDISKLPSPRSIKRIREDEALKAKEEAEAKQKAIESAEAAKPPKANPGGWGKFFGQGQKSTPSPQTSAPATTSGWGNFSAPPGGRGTPRFAPPQARDTDRNSAEASGWGGYQGSHGSSGSPPRPIPFNQGQRPPAPFPRGQPPPRAAFPRGNYPPPDMTRPPPRAYPRGNNSSYPPRQPSHGYPPRGQHSYQGSTQGMFQGVPKRQGSQGSSSSGWGSVTKK